MNDHERKETENRSQASEVPADGYPVGGHNGCLDIVFRRRGVRQCSATGRKPEWGQVIVAEVIIAKGIEFLG